MPPRTYAPQPSPGPIEQSLAGKTPSERARIKAEYLSSLKTGSYSFQRNGIRFTLSNWSYDNGVFSVHVTASDDNGALPTDNPYGFVNPPIKVPNGTFRVEDGQEVENTEENPLEALKQMVYDAVVR